LFFAYQLKIKQMQDASTVYDVHRGEQNPRCVVITRQKICDDLFLANENPVYMDQAD
jgi:hypothetical protein